MASDRRKERTLNELYVVTARAVAVPEINPVLSGRYQMQGPVDETDCDIRTNMALSPDEKGSNKHCKSRQVLMRAESGTCNMCSAPCSSCLHINRALMGSKAHEYSDESSEGNAGSQYSINDVVPVKITACRSGQNTASETSNLLSVNSNHDSFSENAESKACLRNCEVSCPLEDVEMHKNLSSGVTTGDDQSLLKPPYNYDKRILTKMLKDREVLEGHGESISCVSRVNDAKFLASHDSRGAIRGYVSHCSGSAELSSRAMELIEIPSSGDRSEGVSLLKVPIISSRPSGGKSHSCNPNGTDLEAETDKGSGDLPAVNSPEQIEEMEVVKQSRGLPGLQEKSQPADDSDGSDIEEHDVKVCDICGDAGREDLLAICTRCSDGAEHTYCMRETIDKIPEGDWYCEECKLDEERKGLKQDTIVTADGNDKSQSSAQASPLDTDLFVKLDKKDSYLKGNKQNKDILGEKASCKRHTENTEIAPYVKRQDFETTLGSSKAPGPSRIAAISRDLSSGSLDKGKVTSSHQVSSGATSDTSRVAFSPKGILLKSNSFHSTNATSKVKLDDGVVLQKQKSAREFASTDMKEGPVRLIGKSMSFNKSVNPAGCLNPSESKVKMLSPKFSHGQDLKGSKQAKEWNLLERKNSFRTERSLVGSVTGNASGSVLRGDKKIASHGESYSVLSVSSNHESMGVQSDRKLSTLSRSTSNVTRRCSETSVPLGEIVGVSWSHGMVGTSSTNGISSVYDPLSSTFTAERPFCNANECLPGVLRRPAESTNLAERTRLSTINHSRTGIIAGGRSAPSHTFENARPLLGGASASRSLKEVVDEGNKLKAAIKAAMLKKPGIYRKNRLPHPDDELSISNTSLNSGICPQDKLSTSINPRINFSTNEIHEVQSLLQNSTAESCGITSVNNMKHLYALPSQCAALRNGDLNPIEPYRKLSIRDSSSTDTAVVSVLLKMSVIPEHEYIWQGGFEVQKIGKRPELHAEIQAHLSTFASPKVPEVVKKFPQKILLNEVSRLSTWPLQLQEIGVKEDNIALYFFARDLDSYEKSYKSLLERMMRSDLALKRDFDGVELLIFPSNHLPEKSQRWNTLYFLWGVFRGKKVHCLQDVSSSPKKYCSPRGLHTASISLPESVGTLGPIDGNLPTCSKACNVALESRCPGTALMQSPLLSDQITKEGCDMNASSLDRKDQCTQTNAGQDCRLDVTSLPRIQSANAVSFQGTRCTSTPLEDNLDASKLDVRPRLSVQSAGTISGLKKSDSMPMYLGNATDYQQIPVSSSAIHSRENSGKNQVKCDRTFVEGDGSLDTKSVSVQTMKEHKNSQFNHDKRFHGGFASKKQKTDSSGLSVHDSSIHVRGESYASRIHDVGTSFAINEETGKGACVETQVSRNNIGCAERYFPFYPRPVKDLSSGAHSIQDDHRSPEPNLELALGADMKPSKQEMLLPFAGGKVNLKDDSQEKAATEEEEVKDTASLSLSLAFPFLDKVKQTVKSVSQSEQLLPDRKHVNTSLLLFDGLSKK